MTLAFRIFVASLALHCCLTQEDLSGPCVLDVAFVLDGSGSVKKPNWDLMLDFVSDYALLTDFHPDGTRIAIVSFGNQASLNIGLNQYPDLITFLDKVAEIGWKDQNTNTASGIRMAHYDVFNNDDITDRIDVPDLMIVLTDGESTYEHNLTIPEANAARADDIEIFVVGIGESSNETARETELNGIANPPHQYYKYFVLEFSDLVDLINIIVNKTCPRQFGGDVEIPTLPPTPGPTTAPETTTATTAAETTQTTATTTTTRATTTTTRATTTTTRATTTTTEEEEDDGDKNECGSRDFVIILDSSGSIGEESFNQVKNFVRNIVGSMPVGADDNQVGLIQYSTESVMVAQLGEFDTQEGLDDLTEELTWHNHRTNTAAALRQANNDMFSTDHDRPDADNVIILLTDGESNTEAHLTHPEARNARNRGVDIFTIAIGNKTNMAEIFGIASQPSYWFVHMMLDFVELDDTWQIFQQFLCAGSYPDPGDVAAFVPSGECATDIALTFSVDPSNFADIGTFVEEVDEGFWFAGQSILYQSALPRGDIVSSELQNELSAIALTFSETANDRPEAPNMVLLLLDGNQWSKSELTCLPESVLLTQILEMKLYAVFVGQPRDDEGQQPCSSPDEIYIRQVSDFDELLDDDTLSSIRDDLCMATAAPLWTCDFEESEPPKCGMTDDDDVEFTWTVEDGGTSSDQTGPDKAMSGSRYAYIEATDRQPGDRAVLLLPVELTAGEYCLSFLYNVYGHHIGSLDVFIRKPDRDRLVWRHTGPQGAVWHRGHVLMMLEEGDQIGIRGIRAGGYSGDIAVDDLSVAYGPCMNADDTV